MIVFEGHLHVDVCRSVDNLVIMIFVMRCFGQRGRLLHTVSVASDFFQVVLGEGRPCCSASDERSLPIGVACKVPPN